MLREDERNSEINERKCQKKKTHERSVESCIALTKIIIGSYPRNKKPISKIILEIENKKTEML